MKGQLQRLRVQKDSTHVDTLVDQRLGSLVPVILNGTDDLLLELLGGHDDLAEPLVLQAGLAVLPLLLGRTSLLGGPLTRLRRLNGGVGHLLGGVGEQVAAEVDRVAEDVAQVGRGE